MKSNKNDKTSSTNLDSQYDNDPRGRYNIPNRSNPTDNPETGSDDDDDDYTVDDVDAYEYNDDDQIMLDDKEYEDIEHEHGYSVPVAEEDDDYYYNENNPQDDRF